MIDEESVQVNIIWKGGKSSLASIRDFKISIDNPEEKGGTNTGPTPTELLLSSLGGCIIIGLSYFADKLRINLKHLSLKIIGIKSEDENSRINQIDIFTYLEMEEIDQKKFERWIELAEKYCTVGNTLKNVTKISIHVNTKDI